MNRTSRVNHCGSADSAPLAALTPERMDNKLPGKMRWKEPAPFCRSQLHRSAETYRWHRPIYMLGIWACCVAYKRELALRSGFSDRSPLLPRRKGNLALGCFHARPVTRAARVATAHRADGRPTTHSLITRSLQVLPGAKATAARRQPPAPARLPCPSRAFTACAVFRPALSPETDRRPTCLAGMMKGKPHVWAFDDITPVTTMLTVLLDCP